jgi:hypothetical protein
MQWDGITPAQYDALRALVNWENEKPDGGMFHIAVFTDQAVRITDVWQSVEEFEMFVQNRLTPGVEQLSLPGEPRVEIYPIHALFTPAYEPA